MNIDFSISENLDPIALYAAILSTIIAIWEYIKWRARNCIEVKCNTNMLFIPSKDKNKYIVANVTNKGQTATTITHFALYYWKNRFDKFFNQAQQSFIVNTDQVPQVIQPGEQWMAQVIQSEELVSMATEGCLYAVIIHSMGKKEILCRIKISKQAKK